MLNTTRGELLCIISLLVYVLLFSNDFNNPCNKTASLENQIDKVNVNSESEILLCSEDVKIFKTEEGKVYKLGLIGLVHLCRLALVWQDREPINISSISKGTLASN